MYALFYLPPCVPILWFNLHNLNGDDGDGILLTLIFVYIVRLLSHVGFVSVYTGKG